VFLSFAGYFLLTQISAGIALHVAVGVFGILIMWCVAWLNSWYKYSDAHSPWRSGNADMVGGG
jgi:hypothetical protein